MAQHPQAPRFPTPSRLCALACSALLWGCTSAPITTNAPPPSLQEQQHAAAQRAPLLTPWAGTYQAIVPCGQCAGIAISVQLQPDMTATVRTRQLHVDGTPSKVHRQTWPFQWDTTGSDIITLGNSSPNEPAAYKFLLGDQWLEMRHHLTGAAGFPRSQYRLRKTSTAH